MNRSQVSFARMIELDRWIRDHKYPNCLTFAVEYEVSSKSIQRDIAYLRDALGAPLEYDRTRRGFYYTDNNWFLPALILTEGELFAVLVASRVLEQYRGTPVAKSLEVVFRKFTEALPNEISFNPELLGPKFSFTGPPAKPVDEKIWNTVVHGMLHHRSVKITYRAAGSNRDKERRIDPYHIANLQGEWYVFAHDHRAEALSQFAIPRIKRAEPTKHAFKVPPDFDPEKILSNTFGRFALGGEPVQVKLHFDKEVAADVMERQWHPKQTLTKLPDGKVELTFPATAGGLFEVMRWVLSWGRSVRVAEPPRLLELVRKEMQ